MDEVTVELRGSGFLFADLVRELSLVFSPALVAYLAEEFDRVDRLIEKCFDGRLSFAYLLDFQLAEVDRLMIWIGSGEMKVRLESSGQDHDRLKTTVFRFLQVRIGLRFTGSCSFKVTELSDLVPA